MLFGIQPTTFAVRAIRIAFVVTGSIMVWMALCLYEDDFGRVTSIFEKSWKQLKQVGAARISWQARFMQVVAQMAKERFDVLFGDKLISLRSIGVTNCLSIASFWLSLFVLQGFNDRDSQTRLDIDDAESYAFAFGIFTLFVTLAILPFFLKKPVWLRAWFVVTLSTLLVWGLLIWGIATDTDPDLWEHVSHLSRVIDFTLVLPLSLGCDIAFVALTRRMLRWMTKKANAGIMSTILVLNCSVAFLLIGAPWLLAIHMDMPSPADISLLTLGATNVIDGLASAVFVIFAMAMLAHWAFWPFLERTVSGLTLDIGRWRKLIGALGVLLIGASSPAAAELAKSILEKLL